MTAPALRWAPACWLALAAGCAAAHGNFSQQPGFADYFARQQRSDDIPGVADRALLQRFRPRLLVAADAEGPLDFYADYIAQGELYDGAGELVSDRVDRALLNRWRRDPQSRFVHRPRGGPVSPVAYGRLDRVDLPGLGRVQVLGYHFAFRRSGLPAELRWWQSAPLSVLGDPEDWHQLDHYTALWLALDAEQRPRAVLLQQHNHLRSFVVGADWSWPADDRPAVVAAARSNELYPHRPETTRWRMVQYMREDNLRYLVAGEARPLFAAVDRAEPGRVVDYRLRFLPPSDAFYSFAGYLGERRWLPGRDGPPGADYNIWPVLKPLDLQFAVFNWREGDLEQMDLMARAVGPAEPDPHALGALRQRFARRLHCALSEARSC